VHKSWVVNKLAREKEKRTNKLLVSLGRCSFLIGMHRTLSEPKSRHATKKNTLCGSPYHSIRNITGLFRTNLISL